MTTLGETKTYTTEGEYCENGVLTAPALLRMFQETVLENADERGAGNDYMIGNGLGWALVKNDVRIARWPEMGETVTVRTGPVGKKWLFVFRQFEVADAQGETLVQCDSCWMVIDLKARKPVPMPQHIITTYNFDIMQNRVLKFDTPRNLKDAQNELRIRVRPHHIDDYGHVNNTVYVRWALEGLPEGTADSKTITRFACTFKREALPGMSLTAKTAMDETDDGLTTRHEQTDEEGNVLFQMKAEWV